MSRNAVELCTRLVEDLLGDLAATIFGALATHGRLPFSLLGARTGLNPRRLRPGLTALVQQNLVLWSEGGNGVHYEACLDRAECIGHYGRYITLVAAQYGKESAMIVEELLLHGSLRVCDLVKERTGDTHNQSEGQKRSAGPNGAVVNGVPAEHLVSERRENTVNNAIHALREAEIIVDFHESYHRPDADNRLAAEEKASKSPMFQSGPKSKQRQLLQLEVSKLLEAWRRGKDDTGNEDGESSKTTGTGTKRKAGRGESPQEPPRKKFKADAINGLMNPASQDWRHGSGASTKRSRDLTRVRVNFDKLTVLLRNAALVESVEKALGSASAQVYASVLNLLVPHLHTCRSMWLKEVSLSDPQQTNEDESPLLDTEEITKAVGPIEGLEDSIAEVPEDEHAVHPSTFARRWQRPKKPKDKKKRKRKDVSSDNESGDDSLDEVESVGPNGWMLHERFPPSNPSRDERIRQHLFLLASHSLPFLHYRQRTSHYSHESWSVPFPELMRALRLDLICTTIHATHDDAIVGGVIGGDSGSGGVGGSGASGGSGSVVEPGESIEEIISIDTAGQRIARILAEQGKLDEKALTARSLLPPKVLRARCSALHAAGLLELQEVPRDAQRQPARTMFLWYLDRGRAGARIVEDARASMVRLLQRRAQEATRRRGVLEKASRSDVRGHERELLNRSERVALERWKEAETRIWGGVGRLGEVVAILNLY